MLLFFPIPEKSISQRLQVTQQPHSPFRLILKVSLVEIYLGFRQRDPLFPATLCNESPLQ